MYQERHYPDRIIGTDLGSPDFVRFVEAFGGFGVCVDHNRDVADGVHAVLIHQGIFLLGVKVDPRAITDGQTPAGSRRDDAHV
jgi:acetolactate synthase-1/2/3 large subunit